MTRIIFLHGNKVVRWSYAWTTWLKEQLEDAQVETVFETLPDSITCRKRYWFQWLEERIDAGEDDILLGHSTGAVATMRYGESHELKGSILLSPAYTDLDSELERLSGYFDTPWNWDNIRKNNDFITMFYSTDDPYIPNEEFKYVEERLHPETHKFTNKGHLMQDTFPELLEHVREKV